MFVFLELTHPEGGRDRGRVAAEQQALPLDAQHGSQWLPFQYSPAGRQNPGCSAASAGLRCAGPWWKRGPGLCQYAWRCPCACGWCSWLWGAKRMWRRKSWPEVSWMSHCLPEAWIWHLKDSLQIAALWGLIKDQIYFFAEQSVKMKHSRGKHCCYCIQLQIKVSYLMTIYD